MAEKRTELSSLGEFGLIEKIAEGVEIKNQTTIKGIGDDAAVIKTSEKGLGLLAADMLLEGVHFEFRYFGC